MSDIYQKVWNSDRHKFLVSPRDVKGKWLHPHADILLDEQVAAFGRRDLDLARKPLFHQVDEAKLHSIPTYVSLIKLLDNYRFDNQKSEVVTRIKQAEIDQFIDAILKTKVMKIARDYINNHLGFSSKINEFESCLRDIWFKLYPNYFGDISVKDASGFEHIFVGEGKYNFDSQVNNENEKITGLISGYHSWVKFYLDEKQQKANYLGHNYDLQGNIGVDNPYIVTLQMLWQERHTKTNLSLELFKKKGCFFVGTSPECEIAMGTISYYEHLANYKFQQEKRRTTINGAIYDLVLYRNTKQDGSRGDRIRSFYPIFVGQTDEKIS